MFDAVKIEHQFAMLLGEELGRRGGLNDADIFRNGDLEKIGRLIQKSVEILEVRINRIEFQPSERELGGTLARLKAGIDSLKNLGKMMESKEEIEKNDYHWLIVGDLVMTIAGLLDYIERRQ